MGPHCALNMLCVGLVLDLTLVYRNLHSFAENYGFALLSLNSPTSHLYRLFSESVPWVTQRSYIWILHNNVFLHLFWTFFFIKMLGLASSSRNTPPLGLLDSVWTFVVVKHCKHLSLNIVSYFEWMIDWNVDGQLEKVSSTHWNVEGKYAKVSSTHWNVEGK